jgi:RNA polymerase sigma factor (sigma-70 family)
MADPARARRGDVTDSRPGVEDLLAACGPQVLGALARRYQVFDQCEDAVQEALLEAATSWPGQGIPGNPRGWLTTVATRRLIDLIRSDHSRRLREERLMIGSPPAELLDDAAAEQPDRDRDDSLTLLLLCCHPALTPSSQIALTLRAVGGLSTAEIARAFFVPEATMAQRISRAKQLIREAGATFSMPSPEETPARLSAAMHVLYLIFNEGYTSSSGDQISRTDLTREAVRLTRTLLRARPGDAEVQGLLALMLLTDARRLARTDAAGQLVQLADQDRGRWNRDLIAEGSALVTAALQSGPLGPYQLQAAIAACYDEAATAGDTDWRQILLLYQMLDRIAPNPMATLNRALALAMVQGPQAGLSLLATLDRDRRVATSHRLHAMRGHLLELAGQLDEAGEEFAVAARLCSSRPEKALLQRRAEAVRRPD